MAKDKVRSSQVDASSIIDKRRTTTYATSNFEYVLIQILSRPMFLVYYFMMFFAVIFLTTMTDLSSLLLVALPVFFVLRLKSKSLPKNSTMPGKKPSHVFLKDKPSDLGELIFGREEGTGLNIYQASGDTLRHTIIIGSSGSGKSVFIMCVYVYNYLSLNSGFWLQDFKGATDVALKIQSILARFGRSNCARVINYNGRKQQGNIIKQSNTSNPLLSDDFEKSLLYLFGFIPEGEGDAKFFTDGAYDILRALMPVLHHLQEKKLITISVTNIRKWAAARNLQALYFNEDVDEHIRDKYLKPFFDDRGIPYNKKNASIPGKIIEQYSSFLGHFSGQLGLLSVSFSQIHESVINEFDPADVFKNRRCAVSLVPTSGLSDSDLSSLCTSQANLIKFCFDTYLDGSSVGNAEDISGLTRGPDDTPMALIVDELAAGLRSNVYGLVASQARGFGIAFIAGTQDADAPVASNQGQWSQIEGSTLTKIILNAVKTTENDKIFDRWIMKKNIMRKSVVAGQNDNLLTNMESKIEEDHILDLSRIPTFDKGEYYLMQEGAHVHGRVYYNNPEEFELPQFRPVTKLKVIRYNRLSLAGDIAKRELMDSSPKVMSAVKNAIKDACEESDRFKGLFVGFSSGSAEVSLANEHCDYTVPEITDEKVGAVIESYTDDFFTQRFAENKLGGFLAKGDAAPLSTETSEGKEEESTTSVGEQSVEADDDELGAEQKESIDVEVDKVEKDKLDAFKKTVAKSDDIFKTKSQLDAEKQETFTAQFLADQGIDSRSKLRSKFSTGVEDIDLTISRANVEAIMEELGKNS